MKKYLNTLLQLLLVIVFTMLLFKGVNSLIDKSYQYENQSFYQTFQPSYTDLPNNENPGASTGHWDRREKSPNKWQGKFLYTADVFTIAGVPLYVLFMAAAILLVLMSGVFLLYLFSDQSPR
ncbi:MAG: hypothetical protein LHW64_03925 [Candidatus Cloacimonetes bacterium]|jgi:hypothetical protein|nr:hypothetical protein [Candidatus Cloacimonadota bacterium]MCB5286934.1 hypothetical protein [Candidatus Cloacimonadota bacterium]MCK9185437.1 hypothetical protein [Candidatus Cloacimonadota bacterium]MCK9584353.1 hypothetical protein [Candidatus Cloacimonadota bacterium]MDY0229255.1 hypothetical protein [Candidatus Cloacimonadaceae bacterium]